MPEVATLSRTPSSERVFCGLGAPLLDRLLAEVRAAPVLAAVEWEAELPRPAQIAAMAARLVVRNGVFAVVGTGTSAATYLIVALAWVAEADDRFQGLHTVVVDAETGAEPDRSASAALAELVSGGHATATARATTVPAVLGLVAQRGVERITAELTPIEAAVARRRDREAERQAAYFRQLVTEASRPRRQVAPSVVKARVAAIEAESEAKRKDLDLRYALRLRVAPAAIVTVAARVAEVRVRLRRRKGERELALRIAPDARDVDAIACAACAGATRSIVLCDDALHPLCERCAPVATGRPRCLACLRRTPAMA